MVVGHGSSQVLQKTIDLLDDEEIDFFVHWDKKYSTPKLTSRHSKICFIKNRKVFWGTDSQIIVEKKLLENALKSENNYDYFHLISSSDMPLMTKNYFKNFFSGASYIGFTKNVTEKERRRIQWYFPIRNMNVRKRINYRLIIKPLKIFNSLLRVNRNKLDLPIEKGTNWFSITRKLAKEIVEYPYFNRFLHSFLGDETYVQSILYGLKKRADWTINDNSQAARYIDWERGRPFTFSIHDVQELRRLVNTKFAFARKVQDVELVDDVFE